MLTSRLKNLASRLFKEHSEKESPNFSSFSLGGEKISNLQLLQRKNSDTLGKVGMLSWVATMGDSRVKIYECRSVGHAEFIENLSRDERINKFLPTCHFRREEFLMVDWVDGESVCWGDLIGDPKLMDQMTEVHNAFHSISAEYWPEEKCYFFDYLENRFNRFRSVLPLDEFVNLTLNILKADLPKGNIRLSHPDVTPVNVIIDTTGAFKAIDNDLITQNSYYLVDLFTTHRSMRELPTSILLDYLKSYCINGGNLEPLIVNETFFNALWTYRLVGTSLQEGFVQQALDIANDFVKGDLPTHPVIATIKKEKLY